MPEKIGHMGVDSGPKWGPFCPRDERFPGEVEIRAFKPEMRKNRARPKMPEKIGHRGLILAPNRARSAHETAISGESGNANI